MANLLGKADATLVNAAYRMGMASVPPDTSRIFQNQFRKYPFLSLTFHNLNLNELIINNKNHIIL